MQDKAKEGWLSGWTIAVILALLLAVTGFLFHADVRALESELERGSAERLIASLEGNTLYSDGVLSEPLAAIGTLPAGTRLASEAALQSLGASVHEGLSNQVARAETVRAALQNLAGQQEIAHERLGGVELGVTELRASVQGVTDEAAAADAAVEALAATVASQSTDLGSLKTAQQALESDMTNLGTALNETSRAIGNRIAAVDTKVTQLGEAQAAHEAANTEVFAQLDERLAGTVRSMEAVGEEQDSLQRSLTEEKTARNEQNAALQTTQQAQAVRLEQAESKLEQAEATNTGQAEELSALASRLEALEQKLAEALPEGMPLVAWRGDFDGSVVELGQLGEGSGYEVRIAVQPQTAGSLSLVVGAETPVRHELISFEGEALSETITLPFSAGPLSIEGSGAGYVRLSVALLPADDF